MKIQFYIDLPDRNLQRLGANMHMAGMQAHNQGFVKPVRSQNGVAVEGRSMKGFHKRELNRFFPVILLLEAQVQINQWQLQRAKSSGKKFAPLYDSGVYYKAEPPGYEDWLDIPTLYATGFGDCEDIACARTGELREEENIAAVPCIKFKDFQVDGRLITLIHVMVLRPDDTLEDPSKVLGMEGDYQ
jgi:hypothetical protein